MPTIANYNAFNGRHWETGSVANALAAQGVIAPHSGAPYSEAFFMGVSGGAVMGYFPFHYKGVDSMARLLTRNTFKPLDRFLERLGIEQNRRQTTSADKGEANLRDTLEDGRPAIVWADMNSLPYNAPDPAAAYGYMHPIVVYGYEPDAGQVWIADRAAGPLCVTPAALAAARGRVKKERYRLLTVEAPNPDKVATAVAEGIKDCVALFTEPPPKGAGHNFGFAAYQRWAAVLTQPKMKGSWAKTFPLGRPMYAGLTTAFNDCRLYGMGVESGADRGLYADFLAEAAQILDNPILLTAATQFRAAERAWLALSEALLPEDVPLLKETRTLMLRRHTCFIEQGGAAAPEMKTIDARLAVIRDSMDNDFPLDAAAATARLEQVAARVMAVHDAEVTAVDRLRQALA